MSGLRTRAAVCSDLPTAAAGYEQIPRYMSLRQSRTTQAISWVAGTLAVHQEEHCQQAKEQNASSLLITGEARLDTEPGSKMPRILTVLSQLGSIIVIHIEELSPFTLGNNSSLILSETSVSWSKFSTRHKDREGTGDLT